MIKEQCQPIIAKSTNLMNNVRPVITRISVIFPQEIGMVVRVQELVTLYAIY